MQGQKGASLASTRRIYRRQAARLAEHKSRLATYRAAGRTGVVIELAEDLVRMGERELAGDAVPVGVLTGLWKQVCEESTKEANP